ncbi:MAG: outer membrane lipoprotein carrier protein LolA [Deltaproteobacteria bacterium]|nr:outer membrane lipoprotein carrier protein LolA [Deltaproteobacteria bacterium]
MSKSACALMLLIIVYLPTLILADQKLPKILDGIQKTYGPLPGLSLPYEREVITRSMALLGGGINKDVATGQIYFKPPNFVKIQQETPKPETMYTDGPVLWYYVPDKNEAYRYPSPDFVQLLSDIFQGLRDVEERFDIVLFDMNEEERYELKLSPDPPWPNIQYLELTVSSVVYTIQKVEIYDSAGGLTRFILGEPHVEDSFPEDFFRFDVPENVNIIEEEG